MEVDKMSRYITNFSLIALFLVVALCATADFNNNSPVSKKIKLDINPTDVIHWQAEVGQINAMNEVKIGLRLQTDKNYLIYHHNLKFQGDIGFTLNKVTAPKTKTIMDVISQKMVEAYDDGEFYLIFQGFEKPKATSFTLSITYTACTERICLFPYTQSLKVPLYVTTESNMARVDVKGGTISPKNPEVKGDFEQNLASKIDQGTFSLPVLLAILFLGGLLTNLTPCIFPMIPITIRILSSQGKTPWLSSILYGSGIIVTYTSLGIIVSMSSLMFGSLFASDIFNFLFFVIFLLLGITMLGFGNFSWLQSLGTKMTTNRWPHLNTFLMGGAAGLVAAPCAGPILVALIAYAATAGGGSKFLFFAYSSGFALPYIFLGFLASKATKLKVSANIQNGVKLLFAACMFGLALYYLRIPFYKYLDPLKDIWQPIALTIMGIGIAAILIYLKYIKSQQALVVAFIPALTLGIGLFATSQWLTSSDPTSSRLKWYKSEEVGFKQALEEKKPILIDFWAEWCEACKKLDSTTFVDPEIQGELGQNWITIKLDLTLDDEWVDTIRAKYGLKGLPVLGLLPFDANIRKIEKINGYVSAKNLISRLKEFKNSQ